MGRLNLLGGQSNLLGGQMPTQLLPVIYLPDIGLCVLRGVEWVHGLFLFPLVLGKM